MRFPWRPVLALGVLVGSFALIAALGLGYAGLGAYALTAGRLTSAVRMLLPAAVILLALALALRAALRVRVEPRGVRVEREDQPELWAVVDELAEIARTRGPDEIRVVSDVDIAVWEEPKLLGLLPGRRYLEIGLPLLAGLSVGELRAALAHELGHLAPGRSALHVVVYRAAVAVNLMVEQLGRSPLRWPLERYARVYLRVVAPALREQELHADTVAVTAAGREATRNALVRIETLVPAWETYTGQYLTLAPLARRTPDVLLGFRAYLDAPARAEELERLEQEALDSDPEPGDSHPPLRTRLAELDDLDEPEDTDGETDPRPAWFLLDEPARSVPALEEGLLVDLGPRAPWPEVAHLAATARAETTAGRLTRAVLDSRAAPDPTIAGVLRAVHQGRAQALLEPVLDPDLPDEERSAAAHDLLVELLSAAVVAALCRSGRAHHQLSWDGPAELHLPNGAPLDVVRLVEPAVTNPALVPQLHQHLVRLGVPLDYAAPPAEEAQEPTGQAQATRAVSMTVLAGRKPYDLVVSGDCLVLLPHTVSTRAGRTLARVLGRGEAVEQDRMAKLLDAPWETLRATPKAVCVDAEEVRTGLLVLERASWTLSVELTDGTKVRVGCSGKHEHGNPSEAVVRALGPRIEVTDRRTRRKKKTSRKPAAKPAETRRGTTRKAGEAGAEPRKAKARRDPARSRPARRGRPADRAADRS